MCQTGIDVFRNFGVGKASAKTVLYVSTVGFFGFKGRPSWGLLKRGQKNEKGFLVRPAMSTGIHSLSPKKLELVRSKRHHPESGFGFALPFQPL